MVDILSSPPSLPNSNSPDILVTTPPNGSQGDQFFEYQNTQEAHKVSLASFHLEGEANQWWQWLRRADKEEGKEVTWELFVEELWARFGPTDCEDFDEALSKIRQVGSLPEGIRDVRQSSTRLVTKGASRDIHGRTQGRNRGWH